MSSPGNRRKSRGDCLQYNAEKRERNIKHEIRLTEKKLDKLLRRNRLGMMRTPARKIIRDGKDIIKILNIPRKQGFSKDSKRYQQMLAHLDYLKKQLAE